jgi:CRP-like cAMP-binding protein
MPLDWLNTPLDADIGELIAQRKRAKAIDMLRRQLQGRLAPPVGVRLQLADLLMQAGRIEEAVPVLLGLADEFAADGFVAKAVAILKRVDRVQPGRPDIAERLEKLVHQQKRAALPSRPRAAVPEIGIEEFREGDPLIVAQEELEPEVVEAASPPEPPPLPAAVAPEPQPPELSADIELEEASPEAPETAPEPPPVAVEDAGASGEPIVEAEVESVEVLEASPAPEGIEALPEVVAIEPAGPEEPAAEEPPAPANPQPGVGGRIRRALWRFLASLPGTEEGAPAPGPTGTPEPAPEASAEPAATAEPTTGPPRAAEPEPMPEPPPLPEIAASADPASEGEPAMAASPAAEPPSVETAALASADESMSEQSFRDHLLDIVEDVLHRPPSPEAGESMDRARALDLARHLVASRLFKDLSDEELLAILRGLRLHTYEAGDVVVTEGEPGQSLFTLATGRVRVFVANPDGRNFEVASLGEGDFFGEISSLSGRPRSATVVAAGHSELLELDRPTLDSIARTHARVRDILESSYIERASNPEAAAVRAVQLPDSCTRRKAIDVLESHFGQSRWDPRMRLRLADVLLKAGKVQDGIPILIGLADDLAREGFADKAVAILKKIEQVQRRNVEVVNLAPLLRAEAAPEPESRPVPAAAPALAPGAARPRPRAVTDERFHGWLVDLVRDTVGKLQTRDAPAPAAETPALKAYGPGLLANPLFEDFTEEELLAFIHGLKLLAFDPGDVIITEGEPGQSVFILTTGQVKVFVRGPHHHNVRLGILTEGSFFGEISTLSGRPRSATITAASACEILELDRAALDAISATHPRVRSVLETFSAARSADPEAARARGERVSG